MSYLAEVLNELRALHWGSHAKGGTVLEIQRGLLILGKARGRAGISRALQLLERQGLAQDTGVVRDGHPVWSPADRYD